VTTQGGAGPPQVALLRGKTPALTTPLLRRVWGREPDYGSGRDFGQRGAATLSDPPRAKKEKSRRRSGGGPKGGYLSVEEGVAVGERGNFILTPELPLLYHVRPASYGLRRPGKGLRFSEEDQGPGSGICAWT